MYLLGFLGFVYERVFRIYLKINRDFDLFALAYPHHNFVKIPNGIGLIHDRDKFALKHDKYLGTEVLLCYVC